MSDNELLIDYLRFINTSNQSFQSMLEIMNNQQQSFNLLLERYNSNINIERNNRRRYQQYQQSYNNFFSNRNVNQIRLPTNFSVNLENLINEFTNENVTVRPTDEQILQATTRCQFCNIENPINSSCPISQNEFNHDSEVIMIDHCRHIFSPDQILHWFENNVICPLCRYDIRENNGDPEIEINDESSLNTNTNTANTNTANTNTDNTASSNTASTNTASTNTASSNTRTTHLNRNQEMIRNSLLNTFSQYLNQSDSSMNLAIDFYYLR